MISFEIFKKHIDALKKYDEDMEPYNKILRDEAPWDALWGENLKLLAHSLCEGTSLDYDTMLDDIDYFICECEYGAAWHEGMMTDAEGNSIDWSDEEKFYDYQVKLAIEEKENEQ